MVLTPGTYFTTSPGTKKDRQDSTNWEIPTRIKDQSSRKSSAQLQCATSKFPAQMSKYQYDINQNDVNIYFQSIVYLKTFCYINPYLANVLKIFVQCWFRTMIFWERMAFAKMFRRGTWRRQKFHQVRVTKTWNMLKS